MNTTSRDLQTIFEAGSLGGLSDGQLLDRFVARREEAVFEAIVLRHGPMAWGVCRRVLRDHHDAEDAFQATFLVFARKASSINAREKLGNWLYGVAYQTSMKARAIRAKRRGRENQVLEMPEPGSTTERPDERLSLLDRELSRLPEKYRLPVVLCELEGKTHREVAEQLGWPIGTVSGRLSRARALLARRLSPGGMPVSGGSLGMMLAHDAASAGVPTRLIGATARTAILIATGRSVTAGVVSAGVVTLMEGVMKTMILTKLKDIVILLVLALICTGLIGTGILMMNRGVSTAGKEAIPAIPESAAPAAKNSAKTASDGVTSAENHDQKGDEDGATTGPHLKAIVICFNNVKDESGSLCSGTCYQEDGTLFKSGKMTCGHPGMVSEIEWSFLGRRGGKDKYRFTRRSPANSPTVANSQKEVEFEGRRVVVFEDDAQRIVMESPRPESGPAKDAGVPSKKVEGMPSGSIRVGQVAPPVVSTTMGGDFDIKNYHRAKFALLAFWSLKDAASLRQFEELRKIRRGLAGEDRLVIVGVCTDDAEGDHDAWVQFLEGQGKVGYGDQNRPGTFRFYEDHKWVNTFQGGSDFVSQEAYGVKHLPEAFLIDPDGRLRAVRIPNDKLGEVVAGELKRFR